MDEHSLQLAEFQAWLEIVSGQAQTEPGAARCFSLRPDLFPDQIIQNWRLIDEAKLIIKLAGPPPLEGFTETDSILNRLVREGVVLKTGELLIIHRLVRASRLVKGFLLARNEDAPKLAELASVLPVHPELEKTLEYSLGPEGEILDTASTELARVRRDLTGLRGSINQKLTAFMRTDRLRGLVQDEIITRRGGRYVIPIRASVRREVPGLVHDYSKSGATAYVEPLEMLEDNNRLNYLRSKEKQETDKVLERLSRAAAAIRESLASAAEMLTRIDALFAQARVSLTYKCLAPILDLEGGIYLKQARHPLLEARFSAGESSGGQEVVGLDLILNPDRRTMVISGVNAGGKTVALKTMGLLALMAQAGFHLPVAEGSRLTFFSAILIAMGDEQNLSSDLSTFSGHVRRLSWILERAGDRALILLDELGVGTDPSEGAALALSVLDELTARRSWTMTATHYHLLKAWAHLSDRAVNASVRTDAAGRPLFGLDYGAPGFSAGLAMARNLGLDPEVVERAAGYLEEGQKKTLELIQKLEQERAELAAVRAEYESLTEELVAARARAAAGEKKRAEEHQAALKEFKTMIDRAIAQAEERFRAVRGKLENDKKPMSHLQEHHRIKTELLGVMPPPPRPTAPPARVNPGDRVLIVSLGREGRIVSLNEAKTKVEIELDGRLVQTSCADLARPGEKGEPTRSGRITWTVYGQPPRELNLLGLTVDEALPAVEKTLDQATLSGVKNLAIIHGVGAGRLREAVRGYLKGEPRVKAFQRGAPNAGGEGVTLVELKD
ncbi:MAG: Smr/MutS family protein [Thermodesulfobacteriota bacterium]